jgi:membrane-bound lytic murein transglycosylase MltF
MRKLAYLVIILLPLLLVGCGGKKNNVGSQTRDLQQIKKGKELVVLTMNRSTSYFIYRGEEMGFQYELAQQFASSQGLTLKIKTAHNMKEMLDKLRKGEGDIVAFNVPYTKENKDSLLYCGEQIVTHQVLVQRKTGGSSPLTNVTQLVGKTVYVKPGRYLQRLENLNKELGGGIHIREVKTDSITTEDLIYQVSLGKIDYTVTDDEEALLNKTYFELACPAAHWTGAHKMRPYTLHAIRIGRGMETYNIRSHVLEQYQKENETIIGRSCGLKCSYCAILCALYIGPSHWTGAGNSQQPILIFLQL